MRFLVSLECLIEEVLVLGLVTGLVIGLRTLGKRRDHKDSRQDHKQKRQPCHRASEGGML